MRDEQEKLALSCHISMERAPVMCGQHASCTLHPTHPIFMIINMSANVVSCLHSLVTSFYMTYKILICPLYVSPILLPRCSCVIALGMHRSR